MARPKPTPRKKARPKKPARKAASKARLNSASDVGYFLLAKVGDVIADRIGRWIDSLWKKPRAADEGPGESEAQQPPEWWTTLEVERDAPFEEITKSYRKLILGTHPDRVAHLSPKLRKVAEEEAKILIAAYEAALQERNGKS